MTHRLEPLVRTFDDVPDDTVLRVGRDDLDDGAGFGRSEVDLEPPTRGGSPTVSRVHQLAIPAVVLSFS